MQIESVPIDNIVIPPRLRGVDKGKISALAGSMDSLGLLQPITIWAQPDGPFHLVAGAHRLEAAMSLGWEWIDSVFIDADEIDRQLVEIDENLMRSELTPTQQAEHLAKRKELWDSKICVASCNTNRGRPKGFDTDTAEKTGVNRSTVNRAIARARDVSPEVLDEIRGTELDKGTILDQLRKAPKEQQREKLDEIRASREIYEDPDEKQFKALKASYLRSSMQAREWFWAWLSEQQ